jgi:carbamoyltransferase
VLVNTSFNVRGEPSVGSSPKTRSAASWAPSWTVLVVGNCLLRKEQQNPALKLNYETAFELD